MPSSQAGSAGCGDLAAGPDGWWPCTWATEHGLCVHTACRRRSVLGACPSHLIGIRCHGDPPEVCMRHGLQSGCTMPWVGPPPSPIFLDNVMAAIDLDNSGTIDRDEFAARRIGR